MDEFRRLAEPLLAGRADPATTPGLLLGMAYLAGADGSGPTRVPSRSGSPTTSAKSDAAPPRSPTLGAGAARDGQWPIARDAYVAARHALSGSSRQRGGHAGSSRRPCFAPVTAPRRVRGSRPSWTAMPGDPRRPRALLLLAQAYEAGGEKDKALDLYARLASRLSVGRRAWSARPLPRRACSRARGSGTRRGPCSRRRSTPTIPTTVAEAAYRLGEGHRGAGQHGDAVQAYMTAAYLGPGHAVGADGAARRGAVLRGAAAERVRGHRVPQAGGEGRRAGAGGGRAQGAQVARRELSARLSPHPAQPGAGPGGGRACSVQHSPLARPPAPRPAALGEGSAGSVIISAR